MNKPVTSGKKQYLRIILPALLLASFFLLLTTHILQAHSTGEKSVSEDVVLSLFAGSDKAIYETDHWKVFDPAGTIIGAAFSTLDLPPKVKGYAGEIDVLTGLTPDGRIAGLRIISHNETPYYFTMLTGEGFLEKFSDLSVDEAARIDSVTGATVSSRAVINDTLVGSAQLAQRLFNIPVPEEVRTLSAKKIDRVKMLVAIGFVTIAFGTHIFRRRFPWLRYPVWIGAILVVGIWLNAPVSIADLIRLVSLQVNPTSVTFVLILFALLTTPVFGRVYCGTICPFGAIQEIAYRLPTTKWKFSKSTAQYVSSIRYLLALVLVLVVLIFGEEFLTPFEPYATFFSFAGGFLLWVYVLVTLGCSIFVKRFWCRLLCPTGACLDALTMLRGKTGTNDDES